MRPPVSASFRIGLFALLALGSLGLKAAVGPPRDSLAGRDPTKFDLTATAHRVFRRQCARMPIAATWSSASVAPADSPFATRNGAVPSQASSRRMSKRSAPSVTCTGAMNIRRRPDWRSGWADSNMRPRRDSESRPRCRYSSPSRRRRPAAIPVLALAMSESARARRSSSARSQRGRAAAARRGAVSAAASALPAAAHKRP